ncbi:hypothetical protein PR048_002853 [Dryococelus australis]|uniref:Uncharacterized protein n=1 Tax=Dryococelus australis TaxID=614101 RepID=A0ABQ9ILF5_9NEOP|nr:hypothetical protein PR048_002853 [Dryococelus australis]
MRKQHLIMTNLQDMPNTCIHRPYPVIEVCSPVTLKLQLPLHSVIVHVNRVKPYTALPPVKKKPGPPATTTPDPASARTHRKVAKVSPPNSPSTLVRPPILYNLRHRHHIKVILLCPTEIRVKPSNVGIAFEHQSDVIVPNSEYIVVVNFNFCIVLIMPLAREYARFNVQCTQNESYSREGNSAYDCNLDLALAQLRRDNNFKMEVESFFA